MKKREREDVKEFREKKTRSENKELVRKTRRRRRKIRRKTGERG